MQQRSTVVLVLCIIDRELAIQRCVPAIDHQQPSTSYGSIDSLDLTNVVAQANVVFSFAIGWGTSFVHRPQSKT